MFCISRLKLNKFRQVSIPSNKDLFMRVGMRSLPKMADGQTFTATNGTMEELDVYEAQLIKDSQMPLAEDV